MSAGSIANSVDQPEIFFGGGGRGYHVLKETDIP